LGAACRAAPARSLSSHTHATPLPSSPAAFSLAPGSALAAHLARALAPGATPEDADILFTLSSSDAGAPALAKAVYSLRDLLEARADAVGEALPMVAMGALPGAAPAETVAELVVSVKGCKAVAALVGQ